MYDTIMISHVTAVVETTTLDKTVNEHQKKTSAICEHQSKTSHRVHWEEVKGHRAGVSGRPQKDLQTEAGVKLSHDVNMELWTTEPSS